MNSTVLIGRLCADPELKYLPNSATPLCKFRLAVDRGMSKEKKAEAKNKNYQTADFINITVWGKMGESCANYLAKGRLAGVQGKIQTGSYDKDDGTRVYTTEVVATNVEFLEWGDKKQSSDGIEGLPDGFVPVDDSNIPF